MRILVIEDDEAIRTGLVDALDSEGYESHEEETGEGGRGAAVRGDFDLVLLDLGLPDLDGLDVLEEVRWVRPTLPVIVLTARGEEEDRVRGLKLGADDYVLKPFSARELLARVEAVLRRSAERSRTIDRIEFPTGAVDVRRSEVQFEDGERTELSTRELELICYLAENAGRAISREELLSNVWRVDARGVETRTIDMHVARLREKLKDNPTRPRTLLTVRGRGYMYSAPAAGS